MTFSAVRFIRSQVADTLSHCFRCVSASSAHLRTLSSALASLVDDRARFESMLFRV